MKRGMKPYLLFWLHVLSCSLTACSGVSFVTHCPLLKDVKLKSFFSRPVAKNVVDSLHSETDAMPVNG